MLTKEALEQLLRSCHPRLAAKYGLRRFALFGSFAGGVPNAESDVDILVEFERPLGLKFMEFADELESVLGCHVDLLTETGLKTIRSNRVAADIADTLEYV